MIKVDNYSIFGGTGFIGSNFLKQYPNNELIKRDSLDFKNNKIIYFISTTHNYNIYENLELDVKTNILHLCKLFKYIKDSPKDIEINFISSWFVYGKVSKRELPVKESHYCDPKGFYSITKHTAEKMLISFAETFGVKYRILRLCNVMGPGDKDFGPKKNALTWMIYQLFNNNQVEVYDKGLAIRDILHIKDVVDAISLVIKKGEINSIYNIGRGQPTSIYDVINLAAEILNKDSLINS